MNAALIQFVGPDKRAAALAGMGLRALWQLAALVLLLVTLAGCGPIHAECVVRPEFNTYDRVALWSTMPRETEDFFIPIYMQSFPKQVLVERRDVRAILGEQDVLPDRLNEETRAKLRQVLGVKAIVFPSITRDGFAIKVIETDTGAITASVFVAGVQSDIGKLSMHDQVRTAISALRTQAGRAKPERVKPAPATQKVYPPNFGPGARLRDLS